MDGICKQPAVRQGCLSLFLWTQIYPSLLEQKARWHFFRDPPLLRLTSPLSAGANDLANLNTTPSDRARVAKIGGAGWEAPIDFGHIVW